MRALQGLNQRNRRHGNSVLNQDGGSAAAGLAEKKATLDVGYAGIIALMKQAAAIRGKKHRQHSHHKSAESGPDKSGEK